MWNDVLYLIKVTTGRNSIGDIISSEEKRMVYTNKRSIRQSEFYQAQAEGLKPELAFDIRSFEYEGEDLVEYEEQKYKVIRTYDRGEIIELICEGVVNDGDA